MQNGHVQYVCRWYSTYAPPSGRALTAISGAKAAPQRLLAESACAPPRVQRGSQLAALRWRHAQGPAPGFHTPGSLADRLPWHCWLPPHPCTSIHHQCISCRSSPTQCQACVSRQQGALPLMISICLLVTSQHAGCDIIRSPLPGLLQGGVPPHKPVLPLHCSNALGLFRWPTRLRQRSTPVKWRAAEEHRKTAVMAMSHLAPTLPIGTIWATASLTASSDASTPASLDSPAKPPLT